MTLGDFLEVYDRTESFWVNYPDDTGFYDADFYETVSQYKNAVTNAFWRGEELFYSSMDEIDQITHDGDGMLTIELKYSEDL